MAFQHHVIRLTASTAIRADALHYATDLLTNTATIVALGLAMLGWPTLDPLFAIGIALYILDSAGHIGHEAIQLLLDHELPPEVHARIKEIVHASPQVRGVHDVRTRRSGQTYFIQLHLMLDDQLPLVEAPPMIFSSAMLSRSPNPLLLFPLMRMPALLKSRTMFPRMWL